MDLFEATAPPICGSGAGLPPHRAHNSSIHRVGFSGKHFDKGQFIDLDARNATVS
jgi:hypothetical protein